MEFDYLENEFFANDLQKVNVNRTESIVRFCSRFGFPVSSGYGGAQRLTWYRNRFDRSVPKFRPLYHEYELIQSDRAMAARLPLSLPSSDDEDGSLIGKWPYLLSEKARSIHLNDRSVVGAISEAEVIQTIRALQISTALISAVGYAKDHPDEWGASAVADYLCDRSHMSQNGITFFLRSDSDNLLKNTRLKSYDNLLANSLDFRALVEIGERNHNDTRATYTVALGFGLISAANDSMDFLIDSLASYATDFENEPGAQLQQQAEANPWNPAERIWLQIRSTRKRNNAAYGCLPEATISQFGLLYDDPAEWHICDNCGRVFKKYREEKPGKVIQKTRFCKRSCANSYSKKKSQGLITE